MPLYDALGEDTCAYVNRPGDVTVPLYDALGEDTCAYVIDQVTSPCRCTTPSERTPAPTS